MSLSAVRVPARWQPGRIRRQPVASKPIGTTTRILFTALVMSLMIRTGFATKPGERISIPGTRLVMQQDHQPQSAAMHAAQDRRIRSALRKHSSSHADESTDSTPGKGGPRPFVADTDSVPYVVDTGANRFIVNDASLLSECRPYTERGIKGVGGTSVNVDGIGNLSLPIMSDDGIVDEIVVTGAMLVKQSPCNLLPPQLLIRELKSNGFKVREFSHNEERYKFKFMDKATGLWRTVTARISEHDLFLLHTNPGYTSFFCYACEQSEDFKAFPGAAVIPDYDSDDSDAEGPRETTPNPSKDRSEESHGPHLIDPSLDDHDTRPSTIDFNLPSEGDSVFPEEDVAVALNRRKQQRLLTIHEQLGHTSFAQLRLMARARLIPHDLSTVEPPMCPGCAYGKANRKPWRSKGLRNRRKLKVATQPGEVVSVDQLVSPTPGFIPTHRGVPTTDRYVGATVFVDHYSDFTYVHLMSKLDADATVEAKEAFERVCAQHGNVVKHYHADNGLFDTHKFKESVRSHRQGLSFCGVNAHHQNGKAENRIKDVTRGARTALLHAAHRWPKAIHASLWPAALKNYCNLRNSLPTTFIPRQKGKRGEVIEPDKYVDSPLSKFSGSPVDVNLQHFHPFGCPVYVLESNLQSSKSHNKWSDRSRVGIFLCHSPHHASSVPLILNTQTGLVSPQFHCLYDDQFDSCKADAKFQSLWQAKAKLNGDHRGDGVQRKNALATRPKPLAQDEQLPEAPEIPQQLTQGWDYMPPSEGASAPTEPMTPAETETTVEQSADVNSRSDDGNALGPVPSTRSGRRIRRPARFLHTSVGSCQAYFSGDNERQHARPLEALLQADQSSPEEHPLVALMSSTSPKKRDPDTMTLEEAMSQPDRDQFVKAMYQELSDHIGRKHWVVMDRASIPRGKRAIPMVWSMKRKRDPLGNVTKWKARLCAGGHRSVEFVDYWDTYSPVVSWNTVRLIVTLALLHNWHMESIDFVLAFPQAPVLTDIYMQPPKVPKSFTIQDLPNFGDRFSKVYKLLRNLYGLKDAGRTWHEYLKAGLKRRGWQQSNIDSCLFTLDDVILVLYVDDAILVSPNKQRIHSEIQSLKDEFVLTDEGELKDYLGTRFERNRDGSITLSQPRMVERVLELVGFTSNQVKMHDTLANDNKVLDADPDGKEREQTWNYRSVVGCLSYLQAMVRPDLTMAVQQCAQFCQQPMKEHEEAVKRICRYLVRTKDLGLTLRPDQSKGLECYVDADWAGSWQLRSSSDPSSAKSRTGYVIMYAGCPIMWASKKQTLVALSTTEAEYIALSSALREVIAIQGLLRELADRGFSVKAAQADIACKTFEDNRSCIEIATNHKTRPRTKHLSVRLHHFRSHVVNGDIRIQHISTKEQIADIFTKPLPRDQFRKLRDRMMQPRDLRREGVKENDSLEDIPSPKAKRRRTSHS